MNISHMTALPAVAWLSGFGVGMAVTSLRLTRYENSRRLPYLGALLTTYKVLWPSGIMIFRPCYFCMLHARLCHLQQSSWVK